jgi:hypothetical protein
MDTVSFKKKGNDMCSKNAKLHIFVLNKYQEYGLLDCNAVYCGDKPMFQRTYCLHLHSQRESQARKQQMQAAS